MLLPFSKDAAIPARIDREEGKAGMASDPNEMIEKNEVQARQGTRKPNLVYVLGASVVLIIVAFGLIWAFTR